MTVTVEPTETVTTIANADGRYLDGVEDTATWLVRRSGIAPASGLVIRRADEPSDVEQELRTALNPAPFKQVDPYLRGIADMLSYTLGRTSTLSPMPGKPRDHPTWFFDEPQVLPDPRPRFRLRGREEIKATIAYMDQSRYGERTSGPEYRRGVVSSLLWALGQAESPISQRPPQGEITAGQVQGEAELAAEAMSPYAGSALRARREERGLRWITGAEHALCWLTGSDSFDFPYDWPWQGIGPEKPPSADSPSWPAP